MASWRLPPLPPVDPPIRIGAVHRNQHSSLSSLIIRPHSMHGIASGRRTIDQATRIRLARRIVFNNFAPKNRAGDFIKCKLVCLRFFVSMIRDPNSIGLNCLPDRGNIHSGLKVIRHSNLPRPDRRNPAHASVLKGILMKGWRRMGPGRSGGPYSPVCVPCRAKRPEHVRVMR